MALLEARLACNTIFMSLIICLTYDSVCGSLRKRSLVESLEVLAVWTLLLPDCFFVAILVFLDHYTQVKVYVTFLNILRLTFARAFIERTDPTEGKFRARQVVGERLCSTNIILNEHHVPCTTKNSLAVMLERCAILPTITDFDHKLLI